MRFLCYEEDMKISKILNNNAAIINDEGIEKVVMGKGISFQKKVGDEINKDGVDKIFVLSKQDDYQRFQQLLKDIPYDFVMAGEKIISDAKTKLGKKLDDKIYIDLIDHIYCASTRIKEGISVKNPIIWDIKHFYPDEYVVGIDAIKYLKDYMNIELPEDEAGFIALHFVNAELSDGDIENVYEITKLMQEVLNIVKYTFNVEFDDDNVYYYRFITHLRFFAQRMINHTAYNANDDQDLYNLIKLKYKNAHACVEKISEFIATHYGYKLEDEEKMYLTIHIQRLIYKS